MATKKQKTKKEGVPKTKKIYRSSKTGRLVTKKFAEKNKATTQQETVQSADYWATRELEDMKKDWGGKAYEESTNHPHRDLILAALKTYGEFAGVIEIGCNSGPNLIRISEVYPETQLAGIDPSSGSISRARQLLPKAILKVGIATEIPFEDQSFDIAIADASLMYVSNVAEALLEMSRVARRGMIICDWYSEKNEVINHHWARNYEGLLKGLGYDVITHKITETEWPNKSWSTYGHVFIAHRQ